MKRGAPQENESLGRVLQEAEQNLLSAFHKSQKTNHSGLAGDARAESLAHFLQDRLPAAYGIRCKGEVVDYLDRRSGELDIVIFDKTRNAVLSDNPLWITAESLLAYVEVKTTLSGREITRAYLGAMKVDSLRPFKRSFLTATEAKRERSQTLTRHGLAQTTGPIRCFRTVFAYNTDLSDSNWLFQEWERVRSACRELKTKPAAIDRIFVLNRGILNPPSETGTDQREVASIFQQWFINLAFSLGKTGAAQLWIGNCTRKHIFRGGKGCALRLRVRHRAITCNLQIQRRRLLGIHNRHT